jgi:hypothetical protein
MLMGIKFCARLPGWWLLAIAAALAQTPTFEVASIKPSAGDATRMNIQRDPGGGIVLTNVNLQTLVSMAYNVQSFQLSGGPPWLRTRRFDVVAKAPAGATKSQTHRAPGPADDFIQTSPGRMKALMVSMSGLALTLSGTLGRQVIDRTELEGRYDFQLEFAPENAVDSDRASINTSLQEQLGLKLVTSKGPVRMIVIDRAELPAAN